MYLFVESMCICLCSAVWKWWMSLLGHPTLVGNVGKALSFTQELSFLFAIIQARISCWSSNLVKIILELSATHNASHKVKHWNCNNFAADCSIAFIFGTELHHVSDDMLQMFKVKYQRSRSQRKVMYQQQKNRYNTAISNLAWHRKRERAGVAWAASSCNAFTIATFSSYIL